MANASFVDYYELLGVSTNASPVEVRAAFLRLAKQHHPDVGGSTETMQQLTRAYRTLVLAPKRKAYDRLHDMHSGNSPSRYHEYGNGEGNSLEDLSDDEIDDFINAVYAEYRAETATVKPTLFQRFQRLFQI